MEPTHDPILDARALLKANTERSAEEIAVLLQRLGYSLDVACTAARVVMNERRGR